MQDRVTVHVSVDAVNNKVHEMLEELTDLVIEWDDEQFDYVREAIEELLEAQGIILDYRDEDELDRQREEL